MHAERFHDPSDGPSPALAIFIMTVPGGMHTGILHRIRGVAFIQDVMWHEMFRSAQYKAAHHFVVPSLLSEEVDSVTAMCRLIHSRQNEMGLEQRYRIPFAFRLGNNTRFNQQTGELMLGDGLGLTCSTFVLAVFESVDVPLVRFNGWRPRVDDDKRHADLLDSMRNGIPGFSPPADPKDVDRVAAELPCVRVRPEEVAAAGLFDSLPATIDQLEPAGQWIIDRLSGGAAA